MAGLHWRLPALEVLALAVLSLFAHRTDFPAPPRTTRESRDNVYFALHPKFNPVTNDVVDKCLLKETFFQSDSPALYCHRREGKEGKGGKQGLLKQLNCKDLIEKSSWRWSSLHSPAVLPGQLAPVNRM